MQPEVTPFFHADTGTWTYVVADPEAREAVIIDAVLDYDPKAARTATQSAREVLAFVRKRDYRVAWILETHAHADHLSAAPFLKKELGAPIAIGEGIRQVQERFFKLFNFATHYRPDGSEFDRLLNEDDTLALGRFTIRLMHTPGHTSDSMTFVIGDAAFVGDTLFMPDSGSARADFPGGDAGMLYDSLHKLLALPDETRLYLCHDYPPEGREPQCMTTVAEQRENNVHVGGGRSRDDYIRLRNERDAGLEMPRLIIPSVQVNMRAGLLPDAESNGIHYIKVPVNVLGRAPEGGTGHD